MFLAPKLPTQSSTSQLENMSRSRNIETMCSWTAENFKHQVCKVDQCFCYDLFISKQLLKQVQRKIKNFPFKALTKTTHKVNKNVTHETMPTAEGSQTSF